jgi:AraC-like DNA-binding protein
MPLDAGSDSPLRFTTDALEPSQRAGALLTLRERGLLPIEPLPGCDTRVTLVKWFMPGATLLAGTLQGVRQIMGPATAAPESLFVGINTRGATRSVQPDGDESIGDGDAIVFDSTAGRCSLERPGPVTFLGLRLDHPPRTDCRLGVLRGTNPALGLLTGYLEAVAARGSLATSTLSCAVVEHATTLVDIALGGPVEAPGVERSVRAARLAAIKADIVANLGDRDALRVDALAARHSVTPRYVHKLFEHEPTTYSQLIVRSRLQRAARLLRDPRPPARTISAIAFEVGFGDLSYFNRTFRQTYGMTPSEARGDLPPYS